MYLPAAGAGKVHGGEAVIIRLDDYPFMKYGAIDSKVPRVSLVTRTVNVLYRNFRALKKSP